MERVGRIILNSRAFKPTGFIVLLLISLVFAYVIKIGEIKGAALVLFLIAGPPIAVAIVAYPKFGIATFLIAAYLILWIGRMNITTFPLGTLMDGLLALLIIGMFIQQKYRPDWSFLKNSISITIILWIVYNFLLVVNPVAVSTMAWLYTIRSLALVMLSYFVFSYHIRDIKFIKLIFKLWLGLSVLGAIIGFKQQFVGFSSYDEAYLYSDPLIMDLLFINGQWRKFSIFADPATFSYNMVISSMLCIGLLFSPLSKGKKAVLFLLISIFTANMLFSGTRSAYVLFPAALVMLTILILNRKILLFTTACACVMVILIFIPTSNVTLYRFQSAFKPTEDASFNVRASNQELIQPYIHSHPIGGGLGSTGVWGAKFSPGSFLASFPPDSGYVRVAVEMGWIGLLLFCFFMFVVLKKAIENYFAIKDPELKSYCLALILIIYVVAIGNYPQEAITQYPTNVYFLLVVALINILFKLDGEKNASDQSLTKNEIS